MALIIDGKALAAKIRQEIAVEVKKFSSGASGPPGLATVLVGEDPASAVYVRNKIKACREVGMAAADHHLSVSAPQDQLLSLMADLGRNPNVHGILVQLPLPPQMNPSEIFEAMPLEKDVDGFGIANWGRFFQAKSLVEMESCFIPCTPFGVLKMLESIGFSCAGKLACILGRSNIVGKPMAHLLTISNATTIICHSKTKNLEGILRQADLVVAAMGKPRFVKAEMVRASACVIDVGINRLPDGKLCGDVDYDAVAAKAAAITPVPGGVGPMTIAMLLSNTLKAWKLQKKAG
ncbi:MAG: bifunctional 5,10-methylenetetrahydrofolate dehydrogenase/5,10-methenyltetrahydrofolate cyclohydrolase [Elusimicrobia bacterium]|nr:bifunctional 5,10-methylenetetrahydrofolate dehydrogenase/5,10-methenyltetrahydrofolate cyclohydrolase [Elusimicrobiota bacterium]